MKCEKCKEEQKYSQKYDAYYCEKCNEWQERKCSDPSCEFCVNRPEKPQ